MGSQCSIKLEPTEEESWVWQANSTCQLENNNTTFSIHGNLTSFFLKTEFCKSPWLKFQIEVLVLIILFFFVFIIIGTIGNGMVCYVVLANKHMRTPRNLLIFNLASSDLILCLFTQPFNLLRITTNSWKLGSVMCKLVSTTSAINVYVSTFSIIAIALDRFRLIVRPTDRDFLVQPVFSVAVLFCIWFVAFIFASPMIAFNSLKHLKLKSWLCIQEVCSESPEYSLYRTLYSIVSMLIQYLFPMLVISIAHVKIINRLKNRIKTQNTHPVIQKNQPNQLQSHIEAAQNVSNDVDDNKKVFLETPKNLQFGNNSDLKTTPAVSECHSLTPIISQKKHLTIQLPDSLSPSSSIVASESFKISQEITKLKKLHTTENEGVKKEATRRLWRLNSLKRRPTSGVKACQRKLNREKKINRLLISIALVFAASWMPLTLFNIVSDVMTGAVEELDPKGYLSALCNLIVLVSACVNPVLYGWLNENFQREFRRILCKKNSMRNLLEVSLPTVTVK